jgi:hypothetical protein
VVSLVPVAPVFWSIVPTLFFIQSVIPVPAYTPPISNPRCSQGLYPRKTSRAIPLNQMVLISSPLYRNPTPMPNLPVEMELSGG